MAELRDPPEWVRVVIVIAVCGLALWVGTLLIW